jgi:hypothetical protein
MAESDDWTVVSGKKKKNMIEYQSTNATEPVQIHPLNDSWVFWFHDMNNENWGLSSYEKLFTFRTVEDFHILFNNVTNVINGMYYLMREGSPPIWDHEKNLGGAGWTFRIDKKFVRDFWEKIAGYCVSETLSSRPGNIIGVSISPKIRFATIRVWTKNNDRNPIEFDTIHKETQGDINFGNARFTLNVDAAK